MNASNTVSRYRVLVVDDNRAIHDDIRKILTRHPLPTPGFSDAKSRIFGQDSPQLRPVDFELDSAYQGQEALQMVQESIRSGHPYALAFVDVRMPPGWDGIETISHLLEEAPDLQIVICTAYSDYSWEGIFQKLGRSDGMVILKKPFDNIEVLQLAHTLTEKWRLNDLMRHQVEDLEGVVRQRTLELQTNIEQLRLEVADRVRAEESLRAAYGYSRNLIETSLDPLVTISAEGKITDVNKATEKLTGIYRQRLIGSDFADYFSEPEQARAGYLKAFAEGQVINYPLAIRHGSGAITEVLYNASVYRDEQGEVLGVFAAARDITERKQAEDALKLTRFCVDKASDAMFWTTPDARIVDVNEAACKSLGYTRAELLDLTVPDVDAHYDVENWPVHFAELRQGGSLMFESEQIRSDGQLFPVEIVSNYVKFGKEERICAFVRDITERKKAEEILRASEARLKDAQRIALLGNWELDLQTNTLHWSDEIFTIFEINKEQFGATYDAFLEAIHPDDREAVNAAYTRSLETREPYEIVHRLLLPDGRIKFVREQCESSYGTDGKPLSSRGTVQDITKRISADAALRESNELLSLLVRHAPIYTYIKAVTATESRVVQASENFEQMIGVKGSDMVGKTMAELFPADLAAKMLFDDLTVVSGGKLLELEEELNGRSYTTLKFPIVQGENTLLAGFSIDITDRKQAEAALQVEKENLDALFESSPIGLLVLDATTTIVKVNAAALALAGGREGAFLKHRPGDALRCEHSTEDPRGCGYGVDCPLCPLRNGIEALLASGGGSMRGTELPLRLLREGTPEEVYFRLGAEPVMYNGVRHLMVAMDDITDRKQAEDKLRETEARYRAVFEQTGDYLLINEIRPDGPPIIVDLNEAALRIHGYTREELVGQPITLLDPFMNPAENQQRAESLKTGNKTLFEVRHRRKDGSTFDVEVRATPLRLAGRELVLAVERDITERKAAEAKNKELLNRLQMIAAQVPGILYQYRLNPDGTTCFPYISQAIQGYSGFSPEEVQADASKAFALGLPEDMPALMASIEASGKALSRWRHEFRAKFADGTIRVLRGDSVPRREADGGVLWHGFIVDITERKEAERALRESELKFRSLFETTEGAILLFADGRWVDCNARALSIFGCTREQIIGAHPSLFSPPTQPDGRSSEDEAIKRINLAFTVGPQVFEWEHCRVDGTPFTAEVSLNCLELQGKAHVQAIVRDISDQQRAAEALRESEDRFRGVVEGSAMPIFVSLEMKFSYLNPSALQLFGATTPEQLLGQPVLSRIHPDCHEGIRRRAEKVLQGQRGVAPPQEEIYLKLDGTPVQVEAAASPITYQGQPAAVVFVQDITERKRMEKSHAELGAQFNHLQRMESIGRLAGGISHDMNNVLAAVMAVAEVLRTKGGEDLKRYDLILDATKRGRDLLKGLMAFARREVEDSEFFDLNELVQKEAELLSSTMLQRVKLDLVLAPELPKMVGSHTALSTALMNLCVNAMDAMPDGGTLTLRTVRPDDQSVELIVQDTGLGMPPEVLARAMEPFYTTKPVGKGTGLGLSMVFGTVQAHGGHMEIRSQAGQGTEIRVTLPAIPGQAKRPALDAPRSASKEVGKVRVLVVDDDSLVREAATGMLASQGHRVMEAGGGYEALGLIEDGSECDVVVLDLNMPKLDGLETLKRLRRFKPDLPVLVATGYVDDLVRARLEKMSKVSILPKPYSIDEFQQALALFSECSS